MCARAFGTLLLDKVVGDPELQRIHAKRCGNHRDQQLQIWAGRKPGGRSSKVANALHVMVLGT